MLEFIKKYKNKILITIGIVCTIVLLVVVYNLEDSSTVTTNTHNEMVSTEDGLDVEDIDTNTDGEEAQEEVKEDTTERNEATNNETTATSSAAVASKANADSDVVVKSSTNSNTTSQFSDIKNEKTDAFNNKAEVIQSEISVEQEKPVEVPKFNSSFLIDCNTVYNNMGELKKEKESTLGNNGVIFSGKIEFTEGETVLDVLKKIGSNNGISIANNGGYITGINGLNQKDCGVQSGWMYSVNGTFPSKSADKYVLSNGDKVKFLYTCSLGKDLN